MIIEGAILKRHKVFEEDNNLYLELVYEYEDEYRVHELIIPKIVLDIRTDCAPNIHQENYVGLGTSKVSITCGFNTFDLSRVDVPIKKNGKTYVCENAAYVINTLKEKPKEMTLAEIEKKLGHKIKLVSEESKK